MVDCNYKSSDLKFNYGHSKSLPDKSFAPHIHDLYELYYFLSGDVTYYIEGQSYIIKSGDILIINDHELHRPLFNSPEPYERIVIHFMPEFITSFQNSDYDLLYCYKNRKLGYNNIFNKEILENWWIENHFKKIENAIINNLNEKEIVIKMAFIEILIILNNIFLRNKSNLTSLDKDGKITSMVNYINENLEKNLTLNHLAQRFFISKYHLCHSFKKNTGFTITEYISYKRIMKAKDYLSSGMSVLETCLAVGYKDYSNFYKTFIKAVGKPPSKFKP